jgi:chaperonin cofactor prefoldin
MRYRFQIGPQVEQWATRLTAPLHSAWRGRPGSEARRTLGKIGFWIAQPGLDAAYQRQLVALQRSRREVAAVATARKRLELQIAELEGQTDRLPEPGREDEDADQRNTTEQLAELRREHANLQGREERLTAVSRRLRAEINAFRDCKEATKAAYAAAEDAANTASHR